MCEVYANKLKGCKQICQLGTLYRYRAYSNRILEYVLSIRSCVLSALLWYTAICCTCTCMSTKICLTLCARMRAEMEHPGSNFIYHHHNCLKILALGTLPDFSVFFFSLGGGGGGVINTSSHLRSNCCRNYCGPDVEVKVDVGCYCAYLLYYVCV